jgi:hypothetical protein
MTHPTPDRYKRSIVLVGDFNPKIFQPAWFASENLIGKQEADNAKVEVIHADVSIFSTDWVRVEVLRGRFLVETTQQLIDKPLRDLVFGAFTLLRHTPLRVMGINTSMEFRVLSEEKWHTAGHRLAPKDIWNGILDNAGTMEVKMRETVRRDGKRGYIDVRFEPSGQVRPGLFLAVNDHYECENKDAVGNSDELLAILSDNWETATARAEQIIYSLLERAIA